MANNYFRFKQFTIWQNRSVFRVTTDSVLLGAWADFSGDSHILDIGSGTGLLALMAAQRSEAHIVAVEPDRDSFEQCRQNIADSPWETRILPVMTTVQDYSPIPDHKFDSVITNPPYFSNSLLNPDMRKARSRHTITLSHGELISAVLKLLSPDGKLHLVLPREEAELFASEAEGAGLYCVRRLNVMPSTALPAARILMTFRRIYSLRETESLIIETGGRHKFSPEYVSLTKDFYLNF